MRCLRCQHESPGGTDLPRRVQVLQQCGTPVSSQTAGQPRFASPEGYTPKHLAEKILTSKSALEGERKHVTVLFCDLRQFHFARRAARYRTDARSPQPVLRPRARRGASIRGTINQFLGDGFMALFGARWLTRITLDARSSRHSASSAAFVIDRLKSPEPRTARLLCGLG